MLPLQLQQPSANSRAAVVAALQAELSQMSTNITVCNARLQTQDVEIVELQNRTQLHIDYANEKQLEIQELLLQIEAMQNDTSALETKIRGFETVIDDISSQLDKREKAMQAARRRNERKLTDLQGRKFMSCSHFQELCQQASWLLIGYTRVNNQSAARSAI